MFNTQHHKCVTHVSVADLYLSLCLYVHRALFAYDGVTNKLKLADSGGKIDCHVFFRNNKKKKKSATKNDVCQLPHLGLKGIHMSSCVRYPVFLLSSPQPLCISVSCLTAGGVAELAGKFHIAKPQYGLCKVGSGETGGLRIAMISWVSGRQAPGA